MPPEISSAGREVYALSIQGGVVFAERKLAGPGYPSQVKATLPTAIHLTFKGRRRCVVGQGALKSDPTDHKIFSISLYVFTTSIGIASIHLIFVEHHRDSRKGQ